MNDKIKMMIMIVLFLSFSGCGDTPVNVEEVNISDVYAGEVCPFCFQSETELYEHCEILIGTTEEG